MERKNKLNLKRSVLCALMAGTMTLSAGGTAYMADSTHAATAQETAQTYSLDFDASQNYTDESMTVNGEAVKYRAYRNVVYVSHPKSATAESMNIFIPAAYFENGTVNGYT